MKKKTVAGLIAIAAAIVAAVIFAGCIGSTTIYDIEQNPDNYIDKEVTIVAKTCLMHPIGGGAEPPYEGFWIQDKEAYGKYNIFPSAIFVKYDGDTPSSKDEWGRLTTKTVRVRGVVRYTYMRLGMEDVPVFYIDGDSWEYID